MSSTLAERYAKAILAAAGDAGAAGTLADGLSELAEGLAGDAGARLLFSGPGVGRAARHEAVDGLASELGLSPVAASALHLLVDAKRMDRLGEIAQSLRRLADRSAGRIRARLTVARPTEKKEREAIAASLGGLLGAQVALTEEVDESVGGGARVRAGNVLMDGTVARRLQRLSDSLR